MTNPVIDKIPNHLKKFIVNQNYGNYTAQDHAVWRYVMHQNVKYLKNVAHTSYVQGLQKTGINTERIPRIEEMNNILIDIGWAAVCVDGFIPPAAFMEFQAYNVLVIAADIRQIENIEYTPAPDIIHEAAGHAPIIADKEYAEYLKLFGEIGHKAFSSKNDYEIYEAVRHLSIVKEDANISERTVCEAEKKLDLLTKEKNVMSEMAQIRNLHWWTVEYGLIGNIKKPEIYGAGLLSSISESKMCLSDRVKKIPYSIDAKNYSFDITTQQPQLFVTPDFKTLNNVLLEYSRSMAVNKGGLEAVKKAIDSNNVATCVYSSGLQVTGFFKEVITDENNKVIYIKTNGPTSLNYMNKQLSGHDKTFHSNGFGSPVGEIKGIKFIEDKYSSGELNKYGISVGDFVKLEYLSGITVEGLLKSFTSKNRKLILLSFDKCTVKYKGEILFYPQWGTFDLAVGNNIVSAFPGSADSAAFGFEFQVSAEKTHKIVYTEAEKKVHYIYQNIRDARESGNYNLIFIKETFDKIKHVKNNWLLLIELLELTIKINNNSIYKKIETYLGREVKQNTE